MILDHIRITLTNKLTECCNQTSFVIVVRSFKRSSEPMVITNCNHKNAPTMWIKRSCLKIELHAVKIIIDHAAKVDLTCLHKILFNRANAIILTLYLIKATESTAKPPRGTFYQRSLKYTPITCKEQVTI